MTAPFLQLIRNARDCLEHGNLNGVETSDFAPQSDGSIALPSIEVDFRKSTHAPCPISWFMEQTTKALLDSFEMIVTHACSKKMQPFAGLPIAIGILSEDYQKAWCVRFAYGTYTQDGEFVPCG